MGNVRGWGFGNGGVRGVEEDETVHLPVNFYLFFFNYFMRNKEEFTICLFKFGRNKFS